MGGVSGGFCPPPGGGPSAAERMNSPQRPHEVHLRGLSGRGGGASACHVEGCGPGGQGGQAEAHGEPVRRSSLSRLRERTGEDRAR